MSPAESLPDTEPATDEPSCDSHPGQVEASLRITALAAQAGITRSTFATEAIEILASTFRSPFAAIELQFRTSIVSGEASGESANPEFWRPLVADAITHCTAEEKSRARLYEHRDREVQIALLHVPVLVGTGGLRGAVALVVPCADEADSRAKLGMLGPLACLVGHCAHALTSAATTHSSAESTPGDDSDPLRKVSGYTSRTELAYAITGSLRNRTGCEQVALGVVEKHRVRILSISGLDEVKPRSPGVQTLLGAMDECLDAGRVIAVQDATTHDSPSDSDSHVLHQQWRRAGSNAAVVSIPLVAGEEILGVLSMERSGDRPFRSGEIERYRELTEPYVGAFDLVHRANRGLVSHATNKVGGALRSLVSPGGWFRKVMAAALVALLGWCALGTITYTVTIPCRVAPSGARHVGAPHDAILLEVYRIPGDEVEEGDVLCRFDTRELELERQRLSAEIGRARIEENRILAEGERVDLLLARAELEQLGAELGIVDEKLARAVVHAASSGIVISGDLRDRIGDVVAKGEPLFQIAEARSWKLELSVPDRDIDELKDGMVGHFSSRARPEDREQLRITHIQPSAEPREGGVVVMVDAEPEHTAPWLRPGMEGMAVVEVGQRPVWWIASHRFIDAARLNLWL